MDDGMKAAEAEAAFLWNFLKHIVFLPCLYSVCRGCMDVEVVECCCLSGTADFLVLIAQGAEYAFNIP